MKGEVAHQLHPPRLPEAFVGWTAADLLLSFGVGLALAALAVFLLGPALRRRPARPSLRLEIREARALPPGEAMQALAALAARRGLALTETERAALYAADPGPAVEALANRLSARQPGGGR